MNVFCFTTKDTKSTKKVKLEFDDLSSRVIGCAIEVHRVLGPGLLEATYEQCLARELHINGLDVRVQLPLPVEYKGVKLDCGYRIDLLVENALIVELKSVEGLLPVHHAQLITYLKLSSIKVGLLINFNQSRIKHGIKRIVV